MSYEDRIDHGAKALTYLYGRGHNPSARQTVCAVFNATGVQELREALRDVLTVNDEETRLQAARVLDAWDVPSTSQGDVV